MNSRTCLYPFEEVGVDEWEDYHAEAFDFDYHVAVFLDAFDKAFVALVGASGDAHALVNGEVFSGVDAARACVAAGEEAEEVDGFLRDGLNLVALRVAVDPKGWRRARACATFTLEA